MRGGVATTGFPAARYSRTLSGFIVRVCSFTRKGTVHTAMGRKNSGSRSRFAGPRKWTFWSARSGPTSRSLRTGPTKTIDHSMGPSDERDELSIEALVDLSDEADDRPRDRAKGGAGRGFRIRGSGEMTGVDPVWHTVAIRVEAGLRIAELRSGREYQIDRAKLALSSTHRRDPVGPIGPEGGPGRMIVCDPIERDPWVEPLHGSGRVDVVDPEERPRSRGHGRRGQRTSRGAPGWRLSPVARTAAAPAGSARTSRSSTSRTLPRASPGLSLSAPWAIALGSATGRLTKRTLCARARRDMYWWRLSQYESQATPEMQTMSRSASITARGRSMRTDGLKPPLFIVGCGRSGTTIVYELLCEHPDLAWFSNYAERWPAFPPLEALSKLRDIGAIRRSPSRFVPLPVEGHALWDRRGPQDARHRNAPLTAADVDAEHAQRMGDLVAAHVKYHPGRRFINKNTRNSRRVLYLDAIFPDALFLHVIRDPRAVVASLLAVHWWPDLRSGGATTGLRERSQPTGRSPKPWRRSTG